MVKKTNTKNKVKKPDFKKFDTYISKYTNKTSAEQLQAVSDGSKKYNIPKTEARQLLNEKVKIIQAEDKKNKKELSLKEEAENKRLNKEKKEIEKAEKKATADKEKEIKMQVKEMKAEQKRLNEEAAKKEKTLIIEELESTWETCSDDLFIVACEIDWKKAKHYFVKRFMHEHSYQIEEKKICGIKTFQDNKDIILYSEEYGIYAQDADIFIASEIEERFGTQSTNMQVKEIIESIRRRTYYDREKIQDNPKHLRPVGNGLWNIKKKEIENFTPEYVFLSKIEIDHVDGADCPKFKAFLKQVLETDKEFLVAQEWLGYCLLNDVRFSKALLLYGDGENGKCQKGDNKVLMSTGLWKKIKDIKVGEEIISPQKDGSSKFCEVINTHNRFEENVYDVFEKRRDKKLLYTCAGNHIIPIIRTYTKRTSTDDSTPRESERKLFEYDAQRISKMDNSRSQICSFTTTAIEYKKQDAEINPYCLGAWLGDGHFRRLRVQVKNWDITTKRKCLHNGNHLKQNLGITSMDKEIVDEFYKNYPNDNIRKTTKPNNKASTYNLSVIGKLAKELIKLGLDGKNSGNKFIPKDCLLSSIEYRKNLLAGLIDTDGFVQKETGATYYTTKSKQLAEDIKNLVFSLGGYCKMRNITKKCQTGFIGNYFDLSIQFKDYDIPLRLKRKSYRFSNKKDSPRNVAIECIKTNPQQVYGIEVEGDSKWYVTDNWMVTHNSVLLNSFKHFLGQKNVTSISLQYLESNPFAPARLFGKSANIFADLPKKALSQTSVFKMAVAGDALSGEKKGKDSFEFIPSLKLMFSCNEPPRTPDRTRGFFRRWIILDFKQHFPEGDPRRDENLFEKLKSSDEMEGILLFALEGLYRLIEQKGFTEHMTRAEVEDFWLRHSDSVAAFILDMIEKDSLQDAPKGLIFDTYQKYCEIKGYPAEEPNHFWRRFKEIVDCSEYQPKNEFGHQVRHIKGVRLGKLENIAKDVDGGYL